MTCINPTTEEPLPTPPFTTEQEVENILLRAGESFQTWRRTSLTRRSAPMKSAAIVLRRQRDTLAKLMALEMGKPLLAGEQEVEKCAWTCDYFSDHAHEMLEPQETPTDAARSYVRYDPLGPVLAIMPWNFPFWQVFRFAAPALLAGNVGVLKHAPNVPGCALAIEAIFTEAGFPPGVFSSILIPNERAAAVIRHPAIRAVTLTGSERAGMAVAAEAGKALKKTVLELGGSDSFIVLEDVDVEAVAKAAAAARCVNGGQSCIAAKRFIVVESVAEAFETALTRAMGELIVGDPMQRATQIGPMARLDLLKNLHAQVEASISAGTRLLLGGKRLPRIGYFYAPTVLAGVRPGMAAFDEETFGPVAAVIRCRDSADAVRLANLSRFGLGTSIWTKNLALAESMAGEIEAGCVFINGAVKSDARLPFGGIKNSGYGRELATEGMREFVNIKTVWVK